MDIFFILIFFISFLTEAIATAQPGKRKAFFPVRVTALWNRLKSEMVEAPSVNSFKANLKKEEQLQATQYS